MLRQGPDMAWVDDGEQVIVLHLPTGAYRGLPGTARSTWLSLLETGSVQATVASLREEFDAPEGVLEGDVEALVAQWVVDRWVEDDADGNRP